MLSDPYSKLGHDVFIVVLENVTLPDLVASAAVNHAWRAAAKPVLRRRYKALDIDRYDRRCAVEAATEKDSGEVDWRRLCKEHVAQQAAWDNLRCHIRWLPKIFEKDDLSVVTVDEADGTVLCSSGPWDGGMGTGEDHCSLFAFSRDTLAPLQTKSGLTIHKLPFEPVHQGLVEVHGLGHVYVRVMEVKKESGSDPEAQQPTFEVDVYVTKRDLVRFTPIHAHHPQHAIGALHYLASFPFVAAESWPFRPVDWETDEISTFLTMNVDCDDEGRDVAIVAAEMVEGEVRVHTLACAAGAEPPAEPHARTYPHTIPVNNRGLCMDSSYIFVATGRYADVTVIDRASGCHIATIACSPFSPDDIPSTPSSMSDDGAPVPLVPFDAPAPAALMYNFATDDPATAVQFSKANLITLPADKEKVPTSGGNGFIVNAAGHAAGDKDYFAAYEQIVDRTFGIMGRTLRWVGDAGGLYLMPEYARVLSVAATLSADERRAHLANHTVLVRTRDDPDDGELPEIVSHGTRLAAIWFGVVAIVDVNDLPPLDPAQRDGSPLSLPIKVISQHNRDHGTGIEANIRFMLDERALYEVVTLDEQQRFQHMKATKGFPGSIRWNDGWMGLDYWEHPCTIRVFSFDPRPQPKAPPKTTKKHKTSNLRKILATKSSRARRR